MVGMRRPKPQSHALNNKQHLSARFWSSRTLSFDAKTVTKVTHVKRDGLSWPISIKFGPKAPNTAWYKHLKCVAFDNMSNFHTNLLKHWSGWCKSEGGGLQMWCFERSKAKNRFPFFTFCPPSPPPAGYLLVENLWQRRKTSRMVP